MVGSEKYTVLFTEWLDQKNIVIYHVVRSEKKTNFCGSIMERKRSILWVHHEKEKIRQVMLLGFSTKVISLVWSYLCFVATGHFYKKKKPHLMFLFCLFSIFQSSRATIQFHGGEGVCIFFLLFLSLVRPSTPLTCFT